MVTGGLSAVVFGLILFFAGWSWDPDSEWFLFWQERSGVLLPQGGRINKWLLRTARAMSVTVRVIGAVVLSGGLLVAIVGVVARL